MATNTNTLNQDSAGEYLLKSGTSLSGFSSLTEITIEGWIYIPSAEYANWQTLFCAYNDSNNNIFLACRPNGGLQITARTSATSQSYYTVDDVVPTDEWVHIAGYIKTTATKDGYLKVNGSDVTGLTNNFISGNIASSFDNLYIGIYGGGSNQTIGYIDEVRVWNDKRTTTELTDNDTEQIDPTSAGLIGYWRLNGNGDDETSNANNLTDTGGVTYQSVSVPFAGTYPSGGSTSNIKKFNSIAYANLKKINGLAIANIKSINQIS